MTEMVEFFKMGYYSYRGGKKLHQICSATCIYTTVFELKNILASIAHNGFFKILIAKIAMNQILMW